jgi:hypothetical protein
MWRPSLPAAKRARRDAGTILATTLGTLPGCATLAALTLAFQSESS